MGEKEPPFEPALNDSLPQQSYSNNSPAIGHKLVRKHPQNQQKDILRDLLIET